MSKEDDIIEKTIRRKTGLGYAPKKDDMLAADIMSRMVLLGGTRIGFNTNPDAKNRPIFIKQNGEKIVCVAQGGECRHNRNYYSFGMRDAKSWETPIIERSCPDACGYKMLVCDNHDGHCEGSIKKYPEYNKYNGIFEWYCRNFTKYLHTDKQEHTEPDHTEQVREERRIQSSRIRRERKERQELQLPGILSDIETTYQTTPPETDDSTNDDVGEERPPQELDTAETQEYMEGIARLRNEWTTFTTGLRERNPEIASADDAVNIINSAWSKQQDLDRKSIKSIAELRKQLREDPMAEPPESSQEDIGVSSISVCPECGKGIIFDGTYAHHDVGCKTCGYIDGASDEGVTTVAPEKPKKPKNTSNKPDDKKEPSTKEDAEALKNKRIIIL